MSGFPLNAEYLKAQLLPEESMLKSSVGTHIAQWHNLPASSSPTCWEHPMPLGVCAFLPASRRHCTQGQGLVILFSPCR